MERFFTSLTSGCRWLVVLYPLLMLTGVMGSELPCSLIAVVFLLRSLYQRDWQWLRIRWVQILLVLWIFISIRAGFAEFAGPALATALPWIRYPLFVVACALWLLPDAVTQRRLMLSFAIAALFLFADMLLQYATGHDLFGHARFMVSGYERLTGPFEKPRAGIVGAWLLLPALGFAVARWFQTRRWMDVIGTILFAVVGITAIYLSGERMALLLTLMGVTLFCLLQRRLWLILPVLGLLAFGSIATLNAMNPAVAARQLDASHQQISGYWQSPYGQILLSAWHMAEQHPLFGVGTRNFRHVCARPEYGPMDTNTLDARCANHTHNNYTEWLAENGIIALALYLAVLGIWVTIAWRHRVRIVTDPLAAAVFTLLVMRLFPLAANSSQFVAWYSVPFWLAAGFLIARFETPAEKPNA